MNQEIQATLAKINDLQQTIKRAEEELCQVLREAKTPLPKHPVNVPNFNQKHRKRLSRTKYPKTVKTMILEALIAEGGIQSLQDLRKNIKILNGILVKYESILSSVHILKKERSVISPTRGKYALATGTIY